MNINNIVNEELNVNDVNKKIAIINASNKKLTDIMNKNPALAPSLSKEIGNINLTLASLQQDISNFSKEKKDTEKTGIGTQAPVAAAKPPTVPTTTKPETPAVPTDTNTKPV